MSKLKLSTAIREGSKLRPQYTRGAYFGWQDDEYCSCALGAAIEYSTNNYNIDNANQIYTQFSDVLNLFDAEDIIIKHHLLEYEKTVGEVITILNDRFEWTREQIADWLESIGY